MALDDHDEFHVAIVGAGIAGLALAMALHKDRIPFTLYEEAKEYSVVGAGIGFGPNGLQALDLIEEGFRPKYEAISVGNKSANSQHVFFEGMLLEEGLGQKEAWYGKSSWGHPDYVRKSAHRKALLDIMTGFIPIENVKFSKRLSEVRELPNAVELRFADGEVAKASILVGADGIQSIVREQVLKHTHPDQVAPVYANSYCYRGVIPIAQAEDILGDLTDVAKFYFGDKRSCVTYRISGGEEFNFLLCVADEGQTFREKDAVTVQVSHETMMADFGGDGVDERFLRLLETAKPIKWGLFHHRYTSTYFRDRMVLIGDSAHASLPFQAAGAGQGVEDALILSKVLAAMIRAAGSTAPSLSQIYAGLGAYDAVRRPRAQKQLEQSAELGLMIHFQDPDAGVQMEKILPRLQHGRFEWLWFRDLREDVQAVEQRLAATGDS